MGSDSDSDSDSDSQGTATVTVVLVLALAVAVAVAVTGRDWCKWRGQREKQQARLTMANGCNLMLVI